MENAINSSVTTLGSLNYSRPANIAADLYENTVLLRYAKSKKLFHSRTSNLILKKNIRISVGFSSDRLPSRSTKRLLLRANSLFCYVKTPNMRLTSNRIIKTVANPFKYRRGSGFTMRTSTNIKSYVLHPYFTNFESELYKPFWVFLGTPIFNVYFDKMLRSSVDNLEKLDTSFIDSKTSFKEFYNGVFFRSNKKYDINRILGSLSRLDHTDSSFEPGCAVSDGGDYSEESDDQVFRVCYDGESDGEEGEEDLEEFTSQTQTI